MDIRNKEECIEWFINKIEKSGVLKGIIDKDEMKRILQNNIENVLYNHEYDVLDVYAADWTADEKTLHIGEKVDDKNYDRILIHEMLHALSTEYYKDGSNRVGFSKNGYAGTINMVTGEQLKESLGGDGINEGMTEYLTGKVVGEESDAYYGEQRIVKILELFAGKENLINDYIHGTEKSKELIDSKYGKNLFEKISSLRDEITKNNKAIYANYKRIEIYGDDDKFYETDIERLDTESKSIINELNSLFIEMADKELNNLTSIEQKFDFLRELMSKGRNESGSNIEIKNIPSKTLNTLLEQVTPELITQYKDVFNEINTPSIENLISQYQNGELDSNLRGNSSQSYLVDDNNILLVRNGSEEDYNKFAIKNNVLQQKISALQSKGVNVLRTKDISFSNGKIFTLQEKARGKTLYQKGKNSEESILDSQKLVLEATDEQLQKYISDYFALMDADIYWDSTAGNLLYDKEKGFSYIDLDDKTFYEKNDVLQNVYILYGDLLKALIGPVEGKQLNSDLINSTKSVFEKVIQIMKNYPENVQNINFSNETLEKMINQINSKFDFEIDKDILSDNNRMNNSNEQQEYDFEVEDKINELRKQMEWYYNGQSELSVEEMHEHCNNLGLDFNTEIDRAKVMSTFHKEMDEYDKLPQAEKSIRWNSMLKKANDLELTMENELYYAHSRNELRTEIANYYSENGEMTVTEISEECSALGMNYDFEMKQIKESIDNGKPSNESKDIEDLKKEFKDDIYLYTKGLSDLSKDEFNKKYEALGIKINMTFSRIDMKKVASDVLARDVQGTQSKLKQDYLEIESPTQVIDKIDNNKSIDE